MNILIDIDIENRDFDHDKIKKVFATIYDDNDSIKFIDYDEMDFDLEADYSIDIHAFDYDDFTEEEMDSFTVSLEIEHLNTHSKYEFEVTKYGEMTYTSFIEELKKLADIARYTKEKKYS